MIKKDEGHNKYERILPIKTDEGHNKYERMLPKLSEVMSDINNIGLSFANKKPSKKNQDDLAEIQNELNRLISKLMKTIEEFKIEEDEEGQIKINDEFDKIDNWLNEIDLKVTKLKEKR